MSRSCDYCPIYELTGKAGCGETVYHQWLSLTSTEKRGKEGRAVATEMIGLLECLLNVNTHMRALIEDGSMDEFDIVED